MDRICDISSEDAYFLELRSVNLLTEMAKAHYAQDRGSHTSEGNSDKQQRSSVCFHSATGLSIKENLPSTNWIIQ